MNQISPESLKIFAETFYAAIILKAHGEKGIAAMQAIMAHLHEIYRYLDPEMFTKQLVVFKAVSESSILSTNDAAVIDDVATLSQETHSDLVIEIHDDVRLRLWRGVTPDVRILAQNAVVYRYRARTEWFAAGAEEQALPRISPSFASNFCIPTFGSVRSALESYRSQMVRRCSCPLLEPAWMDNKRILFRNAPEIEMRKSLTHFLKISLGTKFEVRPEQVVDESHPVDVKVTAVPMNRIGLIEIKWLGDSLSSDCTSISASHRDSRANKGAKQLADYLDSNAKQAPVHQTRGYYVIIDGRRRGVNIGTKDINRADGMYYEQTEIVFDPQYHKTREDFDEPLRMFAEPVCAL